MTLWKFYDPTCSALGVRNQKLGSLITIPFVITNANVITINSILKWTVGDNYSRKYLPKPLHELSDDIYVSVAPEFYWKFQLLDLEQCKCNFVWSFCQKFHFNPLGRTERNLFLASYGAEINRYFFKEFPIHEDQSRTEGHMYWPIHVTSALFNWNTS